MLALPLVWQVDQFHRRENGHRVNAFSSPSRRLQRREEEEKEWGEACGLSLSNSGSCQTSWQGAKRAETSASPKSMMVRKNKNQIRPTAVRFGRFVRRVAWLGRLTLIGTSGRRIFANAFRIATPSRNRLDGVGSMARQINSTMSLLMPRRSRWNSGRGRLNGHAGSTPANIR